MSTASRGPLRNVGNRVFDSARLQDYRPRNDDIVIATYSKCGTTWMQPIVSMLMFGSADPKPIWDLSPWPDMRLFGPIEATFAAAEAQTHRRFFKSHMPYDACKAMAALGGSRTRPTACKLAFSRTTPRSTFRSAA